MPRTKVLTKQDNSSNLNLVDEEIISVESIINEADRRLEILRNEMRDLLNKQHSYFSHVKLLIPPKIGNTTIRELKNMSNEMPTTYFESASILNILNSTKKVQAHTRRRSRSQCQAYDEGYLTAESLHSSNGSTTDHRSRTKTVERSVATRGRRSRSQLEVTTTTKKSRFRTPLGRAPPSENFGTVTPKVKPNTALFVLRQPKQGEMAISMQGSPLMVNSVVTDRCANVNIPLQNGTVISMQPLMMSKSNFRDIPNLDEETRRQLVTLAQNLSAVAKLRE